MTPDTPAMTRPNARSPGPVASRRGFSVIELMVVVAVLAILAATSVPVFIEVLNNNRLAARSNDIVSMLQTARLESMRRGVRVIVCPSTNGTACVTGGTWNGWIAFADLDADNAIDLTPVNEVLVSELVAAPLQVRSSTNVSGGTGRIIFRPDGLAYRADGTTLLNGALSVCLPTRRPIQNARNVNVITSRISISRRDATATCNAPANP